jgi:hypothetical protein
MKQTVLDPVTKCVYRITFPSWLIFSSVSLNFKPPADSIFVKKFTSVCPLAQYWIENLKISADERFIFVMNDSAARTNDFCLPMNDSAARTNDFCLTTNDFPANGIKKEKLTLLTMICYDSNS